MLGDVVRVDVDAVRAESDAERAEVGVAVEDVFGGAAVFAFVVGGLGIEFIFGVHVYHYTNFSFLNTEGRGRRQPDDARSLRSA